MKYPSGKPSKFKIKLPPLIVGQSSAGSLPAAFGSIPAQRVQEATGTVTIPTSSYFTGTITSYSLITPPTGATINSSTGVVSVNTATIGRRLNTNITVRASNGANTADQIFTLSCGPRFGFSVPTGDISSWSTGQRTTEFGRMFNAQAGFIRFDCDWNNVETAAGVFNWTLVDDLVTRIVAAGMKPLMIIKNSKTYGGAAWNDLPANPAEFQTFCNTVATRYNGLGAQPRVQHFQIWNEPNGGFAVPSDNGSLYVARALAPGYEGVMAAQADAVVIYGGISNKDTADGTDARDFFSLSIAGAGELATDSVQPGFAVSFGVATLSTAITPGRIRITNGAADWSGASKTFTTVVGRAYRVKATSHGGTAGGTFAVSDATGNLLQYYGTGSFDGVFVARHTTTNIFIATNTNVNGNYTEFSGFSFWEADASQVCHKYADHPYIDTVWPGTATWTNTSDWMGTEISRDMRAAALAAGKDKPWWTTEFGGATFGTNSGARNPMTQANQAAMLLEAYNQSCVNEPWREVIIFYTWANRQPEGSTDATEDAFGVVDARTASTSFGAKTALATVTGLKRGS